MNISALLASSLRMTNNQSHNLSITEALCRAHVFQHNYEIKEINRIWAELLDHFSYKNKKLIDWLNIFLFNVCALNQQCISEWDNRMLESTEEARAKLNYDSKKQQMYSNQGENIKNKLRVWLEFILSLPFFQKMYAQSVSNIVSKNKSLRYLSQTIYYLVNKYQLNCKCKTKLVQIVDNCQQSSNSQTQIQVNSVNKRVFSGGQKLSKFFLDVQTNYSLQLRQLAQLISINYVELQPPRKIFESTELTGKILTEQLVDHILRKVNKTQLFSQKMESYKPYELLVNIIFQKQAAVFAQWNSFILPFLAQSNDKANYSLQNQQIFQKFGTFLTVYIPMDYPFLHNLLKYVYSSLLAKYSSNDSFELMKKFVLNRLFLNPHYFSQLTEPAQTQIMQYVKFANSLRVLFYEKKVAAVAQSEKNPRVQQLSILLIKALKGMLGGKQGHIEGLNMRDRGIYINDKLLINLMNRINDSLNGFSHQISNKSKISSHSESQLSFSLRNQSISRLGNLSSNHQMALPNNSSLPHLPKPHPKANFAQKQDQKVQNQAEQIAGDSLNIDNLDELIVLRREYGELKRQISSRCNQKRQRNYKKMQILCHLHEGANDLRGQLKKSMNEIMINNLLF